MTSFIKDEVEPWFEWATTDGPCKDSYTEDDMTAKAGLASVLETYDVWVGHIDSDGNACGEGIAIKLENGRKFKGTFWKNQPYGIVTVDDNNGQYGVYEFAYGGDSAGFKRHGKAIYFDENDSLTSSNYAFDAGEDICIGKRVLSSTEAFFKIYLGDAVIGTALAENEGRAFIGECND